MLRKNENVTYTEVLDSFAMTCHYEAELCTSETLFAKRIFAEGYSAEQNNPVNCFARGAIGFADCDTRLSAKTKKALQSDCVAKHATGVSENNSKTRSEVIQKISELKILDYHVGH